jgi:hypothetical protein
MFFGNFLHKVRPILMLKFLREVLLFQEEMLFGVSKLGWLHLAEELLKLTSLNIPTLIVLRHLVFGRDNRIS